jgi:hypothetical protein
MSKPTTPATYEGQLAGRVAELLPDVNTDERLELLAAMDPDDMRTSLAFIVSHYPQVFDFALVRDRQLVERLQERRDEADVEEDLEPYCSRCGADIGIFYGHGDGWRHWRRAEGGRTEIYDAGHEPALSWAPAGER